MKYSMDGRVRYSETTERGNLSLYGLINYFQDCGNFHGEEVGIGMDWHFSRHTGWILTSWQIIIGEYPRMGDRMTVSTWARSFRGFLGYRNHEMIHENGSVIARANSEWVFMNLDKQKPVRVQADQIDAFGLHPELTLTDDFGEKKIAVSDDMEKREPIRILEHNLDSNHHVNNAEYIMLATSVIPREFEVHRLRAEYKKQGRLGDVMIPAVKEIEDGYLVTLSTPEGEPYFVTELKGVCAC